MLCNSFNGISQKDAKMRANGLFYLTDIPSWLLVYVESYTS